LTHLIREDGSKFKKLSALPFADEKPLKDGGYNIFFHRKDWAVATFKMGKATLSRWRYSLLVKRRI
jgi:hypothetical protein